MSETLEKREKAADRIRDELALTLRELDRRRHAATDLRYQVQSHRELVALAGAGTAALAALALGLKVWGTRRSHRPAVLRQRRVEGLRRAWEHPERVATRAEERPLGEALVRRVLTLFVVAFASRIARGAALRVLPGPAPARREGTAAYPEAARA